MFTLTATTTTTGTDLTVATAEGETTRLGSIYRDGNEVFARVFAADHAEGFHLGDGRGYRFAVTRLLAGLTDDAATCAYAATIVLGARLAAAPTAPQTLHLPTEDEVYAAALLVTDGDRDAAETLADDDGFRAEVFADAN